MGTGVLCRQSFKSPRTLVNSRVRSLSPLKDRIEQETGQYIRAKSDDQPERKAPGSEIAPDYMKSAVEMDRSQELEGLMASRNLISLLAARDPTKLDNHLKERRTTERCTKPETRWSLRVAEIGDNLVEEHCQQSESDRLESNKIASIA